MPPFLRKRSFFDRKIGVLAQNAQGSSRNLWNAPVSRSRLSLLEPLAADHASLAIAAGYSIKREGKG
jgi:hypothetical protein